MNAASLLRTVCVSVMAFCAVGTVQADWPGKPVTIVAPYTPGGNADILARLAAQILSDKLGQTFVVENRPGAGGMLGAQYVSRAQPDGYTFLLGAFANLLGAFFYRNKLLDIQQDLVPVTQITMIPNYIAVASDSKYNTLKEMLDDAKANPEQVSCGTPGVGTAAHLVCELINQQYGANLLIVPHRGGVPAITDVIGGQITFYAGNEGLPFIRDGRLKGLAITSLNRSPLAQDLPPVADVLPGYDLSSWYGIFAPAGTPKEIVERVSQVLAEAINSPDVRKRLSIIGGTPVGNSPAEFGRFIDSELARWGEVTMNMNIMLD